MKHIIAMAVALATVSAHAQQGNYIYAHPVPAQQPQQQQYTQHQGQPMDSEHLRRLSEAFGLEPAPEPPPQPPAPLPAPIKHPNSGKNYADCVLRNMPGINNGPAHNMARRLCIESHPSGFDGVAQGSGKSFFSRTTSHSCMMEYGKNTAWEASARAIRNACQKLYD